jgi:hypothetical protein
MWVLDFFDLRRAGTFGDQFLRAVGDSHDRVVQRPEKLVILVLAMHNLDHLRGEPGLAVDVHGLHELSVLGCAFGSWTPLDFEGVPEWIWMWCFWHRNSRRRRLLRICGFIVGSIVG